MSHPQVRCVTHRLRRSTVADLQSWSNVLGHFALLPANIWSLCPPPSHPRHNDDDAASSKVDPLSQHCFVGGGGPGKLDHDFPLHNNASPVGILSRVPTTFGRDCPNETFQKDTVFLRNISLLSSLYRRLSK